MKTLLNNTGEIILSSDPGDDHFDILSALETLRDQVFIQTKPNLKYSFSIAGNISPEEKIKIINAEIAKLGEIK